MPCFPLQGKNNTHWGRYGILPIPPFFCGVLPFFPLISFGVPHGVVPFFCGAPTFVRLSFPYAAPTSLPFRPFPVPIFQASPYTLGQSFSQIPAAIFLDTF